MKKNLKIVSAAAALLAVAPVVATGVNAVSAAPITNITLTKSKTPVKGDITISSNLKATTYPRRTEINNVTGAVTQHLWDGSLSGNISARINGQTTDFLANLVPGGIVKYNNANSNQVTIWEKSGTGYAQVNPINGAYRLKPGRQYFVQILKASFNFGTANANRKNLTVVGNNGIKFRVGNAWVDSQKLSTNENGGAVQHVTMLVPIHATDITNARSVSFFEKSSGNEVTSGSLNLTAGATHQLNVNQVLAAFNEKYAAHQLEGNTNSHADLTTTASDIKDQLTKAGISVDDNGNFTAPENFSFTVNARSIANDATASMNVNVNVANGVHSNNPSEYDHTVRVWNKKESYIYNSNHERLANGMRYKIGSGHNVVAENGAPKVYHVGGIDAYKLADGHYKGNYVDVRNFSTRRVNSNVKVVTTRARVFSASGRVIGRHNYVNAGVRVKISGTKTIKGHKMYRIATNRYIKAANVRQA